MNIYSIYLYISIITGDNAIEMGDRTHNELVALIIQNFHIVLPHLTCYSNWLIIWIEYDLDRVWFGSSMIWIEYDLDRVWFGKASSMIWIEYDL